MAARLKSKVALVTAAGQGIGRAIAEAFIAEGASVIATDVDESKLAGLASAKRLKLDVRSTDAVEALAKDVAAEFGALDVLVNCAGYVHHGSVLDCAEPDWDFSFDLNVKSMHRTIKAFLPAMLRKKSGSIVNISSAVSSIRGVPDRYAYGATKAAVIGLTKAVAADFIKQGIRANAICPGPIRTRIAPPPDSELHQRQIAKTMLARTGEPSEVAWAAVFLASDESSYVTGITLPVDGGWTAF
jgi:2-keto-3-deoxy-L-fuconate dehydrogenase